jgi:hypothetical protein
LPETLHRKPEQPRKVARGDLARELIEVWLGFCHRRGSIDDRKENAGFLLQTGEGIRLRVTQRYRPSEEEP